MVQLYSNRVSDPKANAQLNLDGRTHFVNDGNLRFHKSRVISARATHDGLLFLLVTSDALNMEGSKRGFRYTIFDVFGTVINRTDIEQAFRKSDQASKAMHEAYGKMDPIAITQAGIENANKHHAQEMEALGRKLAAIKMIAEG